MLTSKPGLSPTMASADNIIISSDPDNPVLTEGKIVDSLTASARW